MTNVTCTIENHAILFALIAKNAIERCQDKGKAAILKGMTIYGNERGRRMAERAKANGDELTLVSCQAYGEWIPDYQGQMTFGRITGEPTLQTFISKCAWCQAWEKHNLLEYGKFYCVDVDNAVFQGFNPTFLCTPITTAMSFGGSRCEFDWGQALSDQDIQDLEQKKAELGTSCIKDFSYHTAHMYVSMAKTLHKELGCESKYIMQAALDEFTEIFGKAYVDSFVAFLEEF